MATAGDLIGQALRQSGVYGTGQVPSGQDTSDCLNLLNQMVGQWNRKRWLIYDLIDTFLTSTGAETYSVGPGCDFDIPRPDRLEDGCFFRQLVSDQPNLVDYPLNLFQSREDYSRIRLKTLTTWPEIIFYDSGYPTGTIYVHPIPQASLFEIHILTKNVISTFANLATTVALPPEYEAAILWNLIVRIRSAYQMPDDPVARGLAKDALNVIRGANAQVPRLRMPRGLGASGGNGGMYNIFSDSSGSS